MISDHDLTLAKRAAARLLTPALDPSRRNVPGTRYQEKHRKLPRHVYPHGPSFRAQLTVDGKTHTIGTFPTPEEAETAVTEWKAQHASE